MFLDFDPSPGRLEDTSVEFFPSRVGILRS